MNLSFRSKARFRVGPPNTIHNSATVVLVVISNGYLAYTTTSSAQPTERSVLYLLQRSPVQNNRSRRLWLGRDRTKIPDFGACGSRLLLPLRSRKKWSSTWEWLGATYVRCFQGIPALLEQPLFTDIDKKWTITSGTIANGLLHAVFCGETL